MNAGTESCINSVIWGNRKGVGGGELIRDGEKAVT